MIPSQNLSIAISRFSMFSIQIFLDAETERKKGRERKREDVLETFFFSKQNVSQEA